MIAGEGCAYQFPGEYLDCVQQPERLWYFRRPEIEAGERQETVKGG